MAKSGQKGDAAKRRHVREAKGNGSAVEALLRRMADSPPPTLARGAAPARASPASAYYAGLFPGLHTALPSELGMRAHALGVALRAPVWLLLQNLPGEHPMASINDDVRDGFFALRSRLAECERIVLVVDSPGGEGASAYSLGRLLQRHCGGWTAVVPRHANSAATLLVLGADRIYMGRDAELGPLDAELGEGEGERRVSALEDVSALERLHASAVDQIDHATQRLLARTGKKVEALLPIASRFVADTMAPMLANIDAEHYAQQARALKVTEDYAVRLLLAHVPRRDAERCARHLVSHYSQHGFAIDAEEAAEHLDLITPSLRQAAAIGELEEWLAEHGVIALGPLIVEGAHGDATAPRASAPRSVTADVRRSRRRRARGSGGR